MLIGFCNMRVTQSLLLPFVRCSIADLFFAAYAVFLVDALGTLGTYRRHRCLRFQRAEFRNMTRGKAGPTCWRVEFEPGLFRVVYWIKLGQFRLKQRRKLLSFDEFITSILMIPGSYHAQIMDRKPCRPMSTW